MRQLTAIPSLPTSSSPRCGSGSSPARAGALLLYLSVVICGSMAAAAEGELALGVDRSLRLGSPAGRPLAGAELDSATEALASRMRCPVCQGLSVADSPTDSALAMKREVRELLAAGYTREQILEYFEASFGEFIRLAPTAEGFNLTVWLLPVAALLVGAGLIALRVRRAGPTARAAAADPELADYIARVRREVGR